MENNISQNLTKIKLNIYLYWISKFSGFGWKWEKIHLKEQQALLNWPRL